jgi:hypothetical protein
MDHGEARRRFYDRINAARLWSFRAARTQSSSSTEAWKHEVASGIGRHADAERDDRLEVELALRVGPAGRGPTSGSPPSTLWAGSWDSSGTAPGILATTASSPSRSTVRSTTPWFTRSSSEPGGGTAALRWPRWAAAAGGGARPPRPRAGTTGARPPGQARVGRELLDAGVEAITAQPSGQDGAAGVLEGGPRAGMLEALAGQPGLVGARPGATGLVEPPVAQEQLGEAVTGPHQVGARVLAGPHQVAGRLVDRIGHPHRLS